MARLPVQTLCFANNVFVTSMCGRFFETERGHRANIRSNVYPNTLRCTIGREVNKSGAWE